MLLEDGLYIEQPYPSSDALRLSLVYAGALVDGQIDHHAIPAGTHRLSRLTKKIDHNRFIAKFTDKETLIVNVKGQFSVGDLVTLRLKRPTLFSSLEKKEPLYVVAKDQHFPSRANVGDILMEAPTLTDEFLTTYNDYQIFSNSSDVLDQMNPEFADRLKIVHQKPFFTQLQTLWQESLSNQKFLNDTDFLIIEEGHTLTALDVNTRAKTDSLKLCSLLCRSLSEILFRKISGLIVLDIPRSTQSSYQKKLLQVARQYEGNGLQVLGFTRAGLLEITKERRQNSLSVLHKILSKHHNDQN